MKKAVLLFMLLAWMVSEGLAQPSPSGSNPGGANLNAPFQISINAGGQGVNPGANLSVTIQLLILFTVLSLAPSIILMTTCFVRIVVVLSFLRQALGLQQPPSQVLMSLAIFMSLFIMTPTFTRVYNEAIVPMRENNMPMEQGFQKAVVPMKEFMLKYAGDKELSFFMSMRADSNQAQSRDELPVEVVIPAFMLSELKTAFKMGLLILLPFLVIDMVIASMLMALGMFMLPPPIVSLPIKLMIFVLVDGWTLLMTALVKSFETS